MTSARLVTSTLALGLLLLATAPGARGQTADELEAPGGLIPTAPVEVDGVVLYKIRGVSAFPAELRAARRVRMIVGAARDPKVDPNRLELVEEDSSVSSSRPTPASKA